MKARLTTDEKQLLIDIFAESYSVQDIYAMNRRIGLNPSVYYAPNLSMMELAEKFIELVARKEMEEELFEMIARYKEEYYREALQIFMPFDEADEIRLKKELNAIIIGINHYELDEIHDLGCPIADAEALAEFLKEDWGVSSGNIHLFTENTTYDYLMEGIRVICKSMTPEDNLLFYFSGHGMEINGRSYLVTSDTMISEDGRIANLISLDELNILIKRCQARVKVRIFDACQCGESVDTMLALKKMTPRMLQSMLLNESNWVTFCSCNINEVSMEIPAIGHGIFTYYLLEGLKGGAKYGRKKMYIEDLRQYVCKNVPLVSAQIGNSQNPQYQCRVQENIIVE